MSQNLQFVLTADGSKTLFNAEVGENYHSKHGALQESKHVFLKSGLEFFLEGNKVDEVGILEVGFGTGLNFLLTADYCTKKQISLNYLGIEPYPLILDLIRETGYKTYLETAVNADFLINYERCNNQKTSINAYCKLQIANCKLENFQSEEKFDILYFDAFASVHQPEMWTEKALNQCSKYLKPGGIFVTYAITGNLKRSMKALGFTIYKIPGAPGKREMLRAIKN